MLQRFNSVLLHDTLPVDLPDLWPSDILILDFLVFNTGEVKILYYITILLYALHSAVRLTGTTV